MSNPSRTQELKIGIGFNKQTGTGSTATTQAEVQTALASGNLWNLGINAFNAPFPALNQEDDSAFYGKGDEFVNTIFPSSIDAPWQHTFFLTSQNFAQVIAFAFGAVTETTPGLSQYVCSPMIPETNGVNLPLTTVVAGIRQGTGGEILDMAIIGMACDGFKLKISRGPGLQNTSLVSDWVGCGKFVNNSGINVPSQKQETRLGAGSSTALSICGVDYLTNARFVDLEFDWRNAAAGPSGYYPGSGQQSGYDIRGRMRYGKRTVTFNWSVELESDSAELAALLAATEGTSQIAVTGAGGHKAQLDMFRCRHKAYKMAENDGFTIAQIETTIMKSTSGLMTATAITDQAGIGADA